MLTSLLALSGAIGMAMAAPTASCTTVTRVATFDDLPTGTLNWYKGLQYQGWEVVRATDTPFYDASSTNLIRSVGTSAVIRSHKNHLFNDYNFYPAFNFGCANSTGAQNCSVTKLYGVPCNTEGCSPPGPQFELPFFAQKYPHTLEEATGAEPENTPNITWTLYNSGNPIDFQLYMNNYTYFVTNCKQQD